MNHKTPDPDQKKQILILQLILSEWSLDTSDIAEITNRDTSTVHKWLDGTNHMTQDTLDILIRHFDLPIDFFNNPIRRSFNNTNTLKPGFIRLEYDGFEFAFNFNDKKKEQFKKLLHHVSNTAIDLFGKTHDQE